MTKQLRALIVEDSERDAELVVLELERGGYEPITLRVDTPESMKAALEGGQSSLGVARSSVAAWDIIISDYKMPYFSGLAALELVKQRALDLPFIIVSGTIGEDVAVATIILSTHCSERTTAPFRRRSPVRCSGTRRASPGH